MRRTGTWIVLAACLLLLCGCAEKPPESLLAEEMQAETLYLRADGTVQSAYVEEFAKNYYDAGELELFMKETIASYNEARTEGTVELAQLLDIGGVVYAVLTYDSIETYADFNTDTEEEEEMPPAEAVSVEDAKERYADTAFFAAGKASGTKQGDEVLNAKKQLVVVVSGAIEVRTSSNILYYTGGTLTDNRTLTIPEGESVVLVYKR